MNLYHHISTGHQGIDSIVDRLRLGDNVVWQTDSITEFAEVSKYFVTKAQNDGRKIVYFRFANHEPLFDDASNLTSYQLDPSTGFESFAAAIYRIVSAEGSGVFYVFDSLTDLLDKWGSDLMVMNFFKVTCPYLYELDTVAYFCLLRGRHTFETIAGIRETTQLLLDLHHINNATYLHAHKVWSRYSPTMFFPHRVEETTAQPVTSSAETSQLFGTIAQTETATEPWHQLLEAGKTALRTKDQARQEEIAKELTGLIIGRGGRMVELASRHLTLADLLAIADREIGTGFIGGKSVGMLTSVAIATKNQALAPKLEAHDSFYIGSDLFFTYIIANGWWKDWMEQKTTAGYYSAGAKLHEQLSSGHFPPVIRERFLRLLEYFGQSPIIVRSSSLLEDNFGNAFSGKYESLFCVNQGTPDERLRAFEDAVRVVYASAMSPEALHYREHRKLTTDDEQMAILVQRVSGDHHGPYFFPHAAGVGHSHNLYVFDPDIDPQGGALRLVIGLGTRAVDRLNNDYARMVALDQPKRTPVDSQDAGRYTQRMLDVLSLQDNKLAAINLQTAQNLDIDWDPFLSSDQAQIRRVKELGANPNMVPKLCDFANILNTEFTSFMQELLKTLTKAYDYPVDIEFTVNLTPSGDFRVCLVQCRPLQTRGIGAQVKVPQVSNERCLFKSSGNFIGGNLQLQLDYVIYVSPEKYLQLGQQQRYEVARSIGILNQSLKTKTVLAIGPGRWGTSTTGLGVPVHFAEINNLDVLVELNDPDLGFNVELSYGSHFFLDLVETGIFFAAVDRYRPGTAFNDQLFSNLPNELEEHTNGQFASLRDVVKVVSFTDLHLFADVVKQQLLCVQLP